MGIMPKRNTPSDAKVKRLTLYPRQKYSFEEKNSSAKSADKPPMRPVLTREKPGTKGPEKIPYFRDIPPKYEAPTEPEIIAVDPSKEAAQWVIAIIIGILAFIFVLFLVFGPDWNGGGGGGRSGGGGGCPTTCNSTVGVTVASQCRCPSPCNKSFPINNPPEMRGYKQCYR